MSLKSCRPGIKLFLRNDNEQKLVSALSVWGVSLKFGLGKLDLGGHTPEIFLEKARSFGFQIIAPKPTTFASFSRLNLLRDHKDPFDRMLIWHAVCAQLTLISSDAYMARYRTVGLSLIPPMPRGLPRGSPLAEDSLKETLGFFQREIMFV